MSCATFVASAIYFRYDIEPISVLFEEKTKAFSTFIVSCCAIIGGVFTVLGLLNMFTLSGMKKMKAEMGKLG